MMRWVVLIGSILVAATAGCEPPPPTDPSLPTDAERDACDQTISLGCDPTRTDREACAAGLVELRLSVGQRPCDGEYDAWIECMGAVSECLAMPGVFCPDEYSALGACDGGRS